MKDPSALSILERARRLLEADDLGLAEMDPPGGGAAGPSVLDPGGGPPAVAGFAGPLGAGAAAPQSPPRNPPGSAQPASGGGLRTRTSIRMHATMAWLPMWLAVNTVLAMYVLGDGGLFGIGRTLLGPGLVLAGFAAGLIGWVSAGMATRADASADRANPRSYDALVTRVDDAQATIRTLIRSGVLRADSAPVINLLAIRRRIAAVPPDPDWASGLGYVVAWRDLHHVEEALIDHVDTAHLVDLLEFDRLRIDGSKLDTSTGHLRELVADADSKLKAGQPDAARPALRAIRSTVNDFRDRRFEALVRDRLHVEQVSLLLGLAAWALLCLAILAGATRGAVTAVSALYLVGAAAGLFTQLRSRVSASSEDVFGYGGAELRQVVVTSGLAAVGGVFLTAMAGATAAGGQQIAIADAFAFTAISVATAAAFGLAPGTLAGRIGSWADTNLKDLESTTANGTSS